MGAPVHNVNRNRRPMKNGNMIKGKFQRRRPNNFGQPPSLLAQPIRRPPFPPTGPMPGPGMRPFGMAPRGMRPMHGIPAPSRMMGHGPRGPPHFNARSPMHPPRPVMRPAPSLRPPPAAMARSAVPLPPVMRLRGPGPRNFRPGPHQQPPPLIPHDRLRRVQKGGRIIKNHTKKAVYIDLTKPWVKETLRNEFVRKDELLNVAKNTQDPNDWAMYREQRGRCNDMYTTAQKEYDGQHPEEVRIPQLMPQAIVPPVIMAPIDYTADIQL